LRRCGHDINRFNDMLQGACVVAGEAMFWVLSFAGVRSSGIKEINMPVQHFFDSHMFGDLKLVLALADKKATSE